jgi:hypothetical protein
MNRDEVRTRVSQELAKRLDLMLYRLGMGPRAPHLRPQPIAQPAFFFGTGENKREVAHRAALLQEHLPEEVERIIHEANNICGHKFDLLGYEQLNYGPNIDWHTDPVHGKRSALKPWFRINFMDFHEVGDHKVIWELNRHQHLVVLAKAWRLSGNPVYVTELVNQWYSWQAANSYPLGINWASSLEVAFRSLSWLWVRNLLSDYPNLPVTFPADLLRALRLHGRYIEDYLSTYFSPNTHLLGEALALFFIGTACPEISAAPRWRTKGWKILMEESKRQVRPDGVYMEQALYYHVYALDFFLHARHLASENGFEIPQAFDEAVRRMLEVVKALSEMGSPEGFGDDDGGRLFNPRRNRVEHMTDPLALGSVLYGCNQYPGAGLTEEAVWLFGDKAIQSLAKPYPKPAATSKAFEAGGIYLINDHEPCPQQLMIDAGPQGAGRSGHGHADALSIRFSLDGRRFLVDPGTYCYVSDGGERDLFRGTGAHNTLRVDQLDQAVADGPFAWRSVPGVATEVWRNGQTFDFFAGSHDGYSRLPDPVMHRRSVFHVRGGLWFIHDVIEGQSTHLLEIFWHFAPELEVKEQRGLFLIAPSATLKSEPRASLALLLDSNSAWQTQIDEYSISPAYGSKQSAPLVYASINARLPEECGILLLPSTSTSETGKFASIGERKVPGVRGYSYQVSDGADYFFFSDGKCSWECGSWASDARLLYCKLEAGRLAHVIMVLGTFARWRGKRFLSHPSHVEDFEWVGRDGSNKVLSSTGSVLEDAVVSDFEFLDPVS